ncbi:hypothetical protein BFL28_05960 [Sphingomonas turrisvirgatae]|uniref:Uncharacterized protein n=1 Tax=Sphingomonas turrisvirgatae TaxID=1888892 RepID=A0A1E3LRZ1_9SPHN|nr:hypothetical protein BFL28_05960 [Sphingomonas turrisvirgatae]
MRQRVIAFRMMRNAIEIVGHDRTCRCAVDPSESPSVNARVCARRGCIFGKLWHGRFFECAAKKLDLLLDGRRFGS